CTGLGDLGQDLLLELGAVAPTGLVLGFVHGVHLSRLVDAIVAAYVVNLKGGMTVRLLLAHLPCLASPSMQFLSIGSRFTLHASFPHSVALVQLRFTSFVVINLREDLHLR